MIKYINMLVNNNGGCGNSSCNCGSSCQCNPGECKC